MRLQHIHYTKNAHLGQPLFRGRHPQIRVVHLGLRPNCPNFWYIRCLILHHSRKIFKKKANLFSKRVSYAEQTIFFALTSDLISFRMFGD